jgi:hypothetical protein
MRLKEHHHTKIKKAHELASSSTMLMMKTNLKTKNNVKRGRTFKTNLTHTFMTKDKSFT